MGSAGHASRPRDRADLARGRRAAARLMRFAIAASSLVARAATAVPAASDRRRLAFVGPMPPAATRDRDATTARCSTACVGSGSVAGWPMRLAGRRGRRSVDRGYDLGVYQLGNNAEFHLADLSGSPERFPGSWCCTTSRSTNSSARSRRRAIPRSACDRARGAPRSGRAARVSSPSATSRSGRGRRHRAAGPRHRRARGVLQAPTSRRSGVGPRSSSCRIPVVEDARIGVRAEPRRARRSARARARGARGSSSRPATSTRRSGSAPCSRRRARRSTDVHLVLVGRRDPEPDMAGPRGGPPALGERLHVAPRRLRRRLPGVARGGRHGRSISGSRTAGEVSGSLACAMRRACRRSSSATGTYLDAPDERRGPRRRRARDPAELAARIGALIGRRLAARLGSARPRAPMRGAARSEATARGYAAAIHRDARIVRDPAGRGAVALGARPRGRRRRTSGPQRGLRRSATRGRSRASNDRHDADADAAGRVARLATAADQRVPAGGPIRRRRSPRDRHHADVTERTSEPPRLHVVARIRELLAYREILLNLVRKELKVKYTASVLGAVWSLLNPVVFLAVFSFVVEGPRQRHRRLPRLPAVGSAGVEPLLGRAARGAAVRARQREPREEGVLPARDPAARHRGRRPRRLRPAVGRVPRRSSLFGYGFELAELWLYPLAFVALLVFTTARHVLGLRHERPVPRRPAPDRARVARVVLDDADRLPGRARADEAPRRSRRGRRPVDAVPPEPDGVGRPRVPAGALPLVAMRRRCRPPATDGSSALRPLRRDRSARSCCCYLDLALFFPSLGRLRGGAVTDAAIEVDDVSKRFRLYREKPDVAQAAPAPLGPHPGGRLLGAPRRLVRRRRGRARSR